MSDAADRDADAPPPAFTASLDELLLVAALFALLSAIFWQTRATVTSSTMHEEVFLSPDASLLVRLHPRGSAVFEAATGRALHGLPRGVSDVTWVDADPLVLVCRSRDVIFLEARSGREIRRWPCGWARSREMVRVSRDGALVATNGAGDVTVRDARDGSAVATFHPGFWWNGRFTFAPDGKSLAVGGWIRGNGYAVRTYDIRTGKVVDDWAGPEDASLEDIDISPDGRWLIAGLAGKGIYEQRIWDRETGKLRAEWPGMGQCFDFSDDGNRLLSGRWNALGVYDRTRREWSPKLAYDDEFVDAVLDGEGDRVHAATWEGGLVTWDSATGEVIGTRGPFELSVRNLPTMPLAGLAVWLLVWFGAYARRRRHPERPTGRPQLGVWALPILTGAWLLAVARAMRMAEEDDFQFLFSLLGSVGIAGASIIFALGFLIVGLRRRRSRAIYPLFCLAVALWTGYVAMIWRFTG